MSVPINTSEVKENTPKFKNTNYLNNLYQK